MDSAARSHPHTSFNPHGNPKFSNPREFYKVHRVSPHTHTSSALATCKSNGVTTSPTSFLAVIIYIAASHTAAGAPEMSPVEGSSLRPAGSAGDAENRIGREPVTDETAFSTISAPVSYTSLAPRIPAGARARAHMHVHKHVHTHTHTWKRKRTR